ncbi:hypothetical protein Tco_1445435, partial [Tanacetum coccineum]
MSNMLEDVQCVGSDTRPPMLDMSNFESWQQRPFQMGMIRETLTDGAEGVPQLGPERDRVFADLSQEEKERGLKDSNFDQLYAYLKQHEQYPTQSSISPQSLRQPSLADNSQLDSDVRGRYNTNDQGIPYQGNNAREVVAARNRGVQNRVSNNLEYFKNKMLLMQAQENSVVLDEEQLLFLAGEHAKKFDDDVDDPPIQNWALNVDHIFEDDQCDAFDSDVDEAPTAQIMFMANLSSEDLIYDEAGPSYDSDIPSEVQDHDNYPDSIDEHHEVHEMQNNVQQNYVVDSDAKYTSDSNINLYDQYVEDNAEQVVQSNVSSVPNDALMMIINDMHEQAA